ncbi:MAG: hypothetical protein BGN89_20735 [Alphaproteobacteria bacterium 64-6]|nr:MAG: hypothetical protein BGN89_20735 [Alphaproteobacteria bacterium 64-6]
MANAERSYAWLYRSQKEAVSKFARRLVLDRLVDLLTEAILHQILQFRFGREAKFELKHNLLGH